MFLNNYNQYYMNMTIHIFDLEMIYPTTKLPPNQKPIMARATMLVTQLIETRQLV